MKKNLKIIVFSFLGLFALIGLVFTAVFVGMKFELFNVRGSIDGRNSFFLGDEKPDKNSVSKTPDYSCVNKSSKCNWNETREWQVVAGGLSKDSEVIKRVSKETGVPTRLIASVVVPEQIRFFTAEREVFKRYFEPLKILGSLSKFSLGVSGIKQDTAINVEKYANDVNSEFYPGTGYSDLIVYSPNEDSNREIFNRLTDEKDHYYSYLYTAIFIKEILVQWEKAGFDISDQPAIIATLFNLGFDSSVPKSNPQIGGATISVGGNNYSFGALAEKFYKSEELNLF